MRLIGKLSQHSRGVGSIIGSVFVALILLSGFAFYAVTQDITQHYNNTMSSMNDLDWNRNQENIVIKQIGITGTNKLNVTAENDGSVQSHLIWLGIFNTTVTPQNQTYQALSEFIAPGETDNMVSNSTVTVGNKYVIQLVTELGNTAESKFYPASYVSCALTLVTAPPTVYQGNNVTVLLTVTPNDTVVDSIQSLTATLNVTPANLVQLVGNSSLSVSGLARGTSAFFWWVYNTVNTGTVTFNATYLQAPAGTYTLSTEQIVSPPQQGDVTITGINCTALQNPSQWNLTGATQNATGSISDLASNDSSYAVFRSYYTGRTVYANSYVSNNVSGGVGTHSNFTAMQYGPDSINDTLTEANTGGAGYHWGIDSSSFTSRATHSEYRYMGGTSPNVDNMVVTKLHIRYYGTGTVAIALYTGGTLNSPTGATKRTEAYNVSVSTGWNTINVPAYNWSKNTVTWIGWCHGGGSVYYSDNYQDAGDFQPGQGRWSQDSPADANERSLMPINPGGGSFYDTWYAVYAEYDAPSYSMALDVQWTGLNYHQQNTSLWISGGTMSTNENISVDVWASSWQNVFTKLSSGWNNVSVSSYLTSTNFTIRFRDQNPGDMAQDSWQIDVCLLQLSNTTDEYTTEVEFTGSSNSQSWTGLVWLVDSSWDTGNVSVTSQVYNYTLGNYTSSGNGYVSYVSSATPYTDETRSQTITSGATQFRNSTSPYYWKVKIKGVKSTGTPFQMRIDWIELQDSYAYVGDNVPYKAWVWYTIQATGASGNPIPFTFASLYANGTTVAFQNATDGTSVPDPAWVRLDAIGTFQLQIRSTSGSGETFVLYAAVGNIVQQKTITQAAQQ
jgi:hypothetical protein